MSADKRKRLPRLQMLLKWINDGYDNRRIHSGPLTRDLKYLIRGGFVETKRHTYWGCFMTDTKRTFLRLTFLGRLELTKAIVNEPSKFLAPPQKRAQRVEKKPRAAVRRATQRED